MVLNCVADIMAFFVYGGQAVVREDICKKYFPTPPFFSGAGVWQEIFFFYYIFSFISRLLIRADAPSDKPPASADLSPAHISALWKYPNVPASPAPILSPPRCRPYAPQRNVSTYAA